MAKTMLGGVSVREARGVVTDLLEKLGGRTGEMWLNATKHFLRGEDPWRPASLVWRTIKVGNNLIVDFLSSLETAGVLVDQRAKRILSDQQFLDSVSQVEREVDLVKVAVAELGFVTKVRHQDILEQAQELGFLLCSPEIGPQLRLQYPDQPQGEDLNIGMIPLRITLNASYIFSVVHDKCGKQVLCGRMCYLNTFCDPSSLWVFTR